MTERATKRWPNPSLSSLYDAILAILWLRDGKHEAHGRVTLDANAASTPLADNRIGGDTKVFLFPASAGAAAEFMSGALYQGTTTKGSAVIHHTNNASTTRTFNYLLAG